VVAGVQLRHQGGDRLDALRWRDGGGGSKTQKQEAGRKGGISATMS
jgi:hypothetical protein